MNVSQSWKGSHWRKLHFSCWKCPALRVDTFLSPCKRFRPCFGIPNMLPLQGDNKKMEDAKFYLSLPGTKAEMEEKELQASKALANFTPTKDSTKDSFQIATLICSTKLTQNGRRDEWHQNWVFSLVSIDFFVSLGALDPVRGCLLRCSSGQSGFCTQLFMNSTVVPCDVDNKRRTLVLAEECQSPA